MGCHFPLRGIFPTQGLNPSVLCLLYWQTGSPSLSLLGSPCKVTTPLIIGTESPLQSRTVRNLRFILFNRLTCHSLMDTGTRQESPGSETKDFITHSQQREGLPGGSIGEESTNNGGDCLQHKRARFDPCVWKIPWKRKWQSTPVFLTEKSQGQRSLVGYSLWSCKSQTLLSD